MWWKIQARVAVLGFGGAAIAYTAFGVHTVELVAFLVFSLGLYVAASDMMREP